MCLTQASLNIVRCAQRLDTPSNSPAAVEHDCAIGTQCQITMTQVSTFLRYIMQKVFDISTEHNNLLAWSCNSIHLTADNLLHPARLSNSFIKNCLQWCSNTFLMYLHNTFYMVDQHTKAITLGLDPPDRGLA
jgi:hypothetical protein